jgi:carboxyl-terminal processing protease
MVLEHFGMDFLRALRQRWPQLQTAVAALTIFITGFALGNQFALSAAQSSTQPPAGTEELFEPFWQVYNLIQTQYVDPVDSQQLVDGAISGMVDALGDEFSGYMDAASFPLINEDLSGAIEGIGVVISTIEDTGEIEVATVLEGAPARDAGIEPGDVFTKVDGQDVLGMSQLELATLVRGQAGSEVMITMRRDEELLDFIVTRARIEIPNIEWEILDGEIGYIRLNQFSPEARREIDDALTSLDAKNLNGLIVDFRGNPGGLLTSAIDVTSAFLREGVVLIEDFGDGEEEVFKANGNYSGLEIPLVILVDENSASGSELVAGALQDNDVATIIGETTFGKGTVQSWNELVNGGGIRLTIARWLTPDRHWIHEQGVTPDITIEWEGITYGEPEDIQLDAAVDYLQGEIDSAAVTVE